MKKPIFKRLHRNILNIKPAPYLPVFNIVVTGSAFSAHVPDELIPLPAIPWGLAHHRRSAFQRNTTSYLDLHLTATAFTSSTVQRTPLMTKLSPTKTAAPTTTYVRSINDYTLSCHEFFVSVHGGPPVASNIIYVKQAPFTEIGNMVRAISSIASDLNFNEALTKSARYYSDDPDYDEPYSVQHQMLISFLSPDNSDGFSVEFLGAGNVTAITVLSQSIKTCETVSKQILDIKNQFKTISVERAKKTFYTISSSQQDFELEDLNIKAEYTPTDIEINYNDDFIAVNERIQDCINSDKRGLILLYGIPGSGKTSYIKHLITGPAKRRIIYIPPHLASAIASPNFISFVKRELSNCVLIIEDAEQVLLSRESSESHKDAVSNILNMTDGILADALNILIVCTFNTEMQYIDKALLRKGRLLVQYKFCALSVEKTNAICERLYGKKPDVSLPLSDIYNLEYDLAPPYFTPDKNSKFGFTP